MLICLIEVGGVKRFWEASAKVNREFQQIEWDEPLMDDCRHLVRLAIREDLDRHLDVTTLSLIEPDTKGRASLVARQQGVICGMQAAELVLEEMDSSATWTANVRDAEAVAAGTLLGTLAGSARDMLTAERLLLNMIGRLSGIATLSRRYVDQVSGTAARIYDTRKTTPGWRRLEKFAVRCGGARNHRTGLFDAVLIKDNHLAIVGEQAGGPLTPAEAVLRARRRLAEMLPDGAEKMIVEVEVDSLDQLAQVLPQAPDIVLLDNMSTDQLRSAVAKRDAASVATQLEASGGVTLESVRDIALTGVDRISVGALTHSAISLDVGLDW
jgi:nicotinate-nucleotide pyrophosphorylase (carboxylating)